MQTFEPVTNIRTMRTSRYLDEGKRLFRSIVKHKDDGNTVFAFGLLGSGKTTLIRQLMFAITYYNPKTKKYEKETAIWRGREHDDWISFPENSTVLFIHENDMNEEYGRKTIFLRDDTNEEIPIDELPPIKLYHDAEDLYNKIVPKKINIVYEPEDYFVSDKIATIIKKKGMGNINNFKKFTESPIDPPLFWIEFFAFLVENKGNEFISVFFDEIDDLIEAQPAGVRWYLQGLLRNLAKNFRRRRISLYATAHKTSDIGPWMTSKTQCYLYCKGSRPVKDSIVYRTLPLLLEKGEAIIDYGNFGLISYDKIDSPYKVIRTHWVSDELQDKLNNWDEIVEEQKKAEKVANKKPNYLERRKMPGYDREIYLNSCKIDNCNRMINNYTILLDEIPKDDPKRSVIVERLNKQIRKMELLEEKREELFILRDTCTDQSNTPECAVETN